MTQVMAAPDVVPLLQEIRKVSSAIQGAWADRGYELEAFPEIALSATDGIDFRPLGEVDAVCALLADPEVAALQEGTTFSDLYIKLYDNGRFWVEILNWWGSDINIHDHDFSGAQFQLRGRSLNVGYQFDRAAEIGGVNFGSVSVANAEVWQEGDRSVVLPGRLAPHDVNHLDVPTVSLLFRTHPRPRYGPQWNYFPSSVAASYGIADIVFRKNLKALRLLSEGKRETFHTAFRRFVEGKSLSHALFTMVKMVDILFEREHVNLVEDIAASDGELSECVVESAALYRASGLFIKALKTSPEMNYDDVLFLSLLSAAFDQRSYDRILGKLAVVQASPDTAAAWSRLARTLAPQDWAQLRSAAALLGTAPPPVSSPARHEGRDDSVAIPTR